MEHPQKTIFRVLSLLTVSAEIMRVFQISLALAHATAIVESNEFAPQPSVIVALEDQGFDEIRKSVKNKKND